MLIIVFSFASLSDDGSQHVYRVHWFLLVCRAALLSPGLNLPMLFVWPADTLLWVRLLQFWRAGGNTSGKATTKKQKQVVSANFSILFYCVKIPREGYLMYQKWHKSLLCLRRSVLLNCQKASMSVLLSNFYSVVAKFCLKSRVQLIGVVRVTVLHSGCPSVAEFQKCSQ